MTAAVAAKAPRGRLKPERILVDGAEIGLLRMGAPDRSPVLLVHGFSGDMLTWQFNLAPLARDHHVIAIDLPGHGLSSAAPGIGPWRAMVDWLARLVDALGLERPHLIGHSLGGRLTLGLVEQGLVEARSLSLISCAGISPDHDYDFLERLSRVATIEDATACARHLLGGAKLDPDWFARTMHAKLIEQDTRLAMAEFLKRNFAEGRLLPTVPTDWSHVPCPLQLIWGRDDRIVPLPGPEWLPADRPIHLLDAVGHLPHLAAPDRVNALLGHFLRAADSNRPTLPAFTSIS
jgi:pimeloyl-ACP methyl ester carboxylesterase